MGIFDSIKNAFSSKADTDAADHPPKAEHEPVNVSPAQTPEVEATGGTPAVASGHEGRGYTVVSGDTLWKISEEMYGDGSLYMKIFEANTDLLKNPDQIFPGQTLVIPDAGKGH